jgi:uncharacterized protein (TIGR00255 family)
MLSMTGFGRGEASGDNYKIEVEMKSVNHRYLDVNIRLPRKLTFLDSFIRSRIKEFASRGKIDVYVSLEDSCEKGGNITYNKEIAGSYLSGIQEISKDFSLDVQVDAYQLSCFPDVFSVAEQPLDEQSLSDLMGEALSSAARQFVESRKIEGEKLQKDLLEKLDNIQHIVEQISRRSPEIIKEYRQKIEGKVRELLGENHIDENVLASEIIIFADKVCVDEEMVRLKTHVSHMKETILGDGCVGRKLDFLTQEMNRESNTILSKSNDIQVSDWGIDLKTEIEKIREQIQNIE